MVGKPRTVCGNPLWLEWTKEIQQEVADNDKGDTGFANKTYAKACKSIAACPIPYSNLNELLSLQNVGKVVLSRLVKKQKEYYLARGVEIPPNGGGGLEVSANAGADPQPVGDAPSGSRPSSRGKAAAAGADDDSDQGEASDSSFNMRLQVGGGSKRAAELEARRVKRQRLAEAGEDSDTVISQALLERQAQKKTRGGGGSGRGRGGGAAKKTPAPRVKKTYVPEKASGAYALLVGLLVRLPDYLQQPLPPLNSTDQEAEDVREDHITRHLIANQLTKSDLMNEASEHCRVSMHTSENGHWATGWTAMKSLLTKELVVKKGNPARYHLTREGYTCALGVWTAANSESGGLPAVSVPIEAMGGFRYALPPQQSSQAGPGPSTMAITANRAAAAVRPSLTAGQAGSRSKKQKPADNAYTAIIDDMVFHDDYPASYDDALVSGSNGGEQSMPTLESRTAEGLQFWYISPEGERVKNRHEAALEPPSAGLTGTMVQVEIPAKDLGHPVARRYQRWAQSHGLFFRGYILEDTAPEVCAGIGGANMDTADLARSNGRPGSSLGIRNPSGGLSDLGSSPVPPTRYHEQSLHDSRRAQLSRSATDGFHTDETLLLEDLFGTKKKKMTDMTAQRSGDPLSRTTSMPASIPLRYNRGRRELGKQAPVITVSRAGVLPRREDKAVSGSGGSGNPRDVLNAYSARREASRKMPVPAEPKPTDELDFSPAPGPLFNSDRRNPSFTPDPARALASSPTPVFDNELDDLASPPMFVDDIDVPVAVNIPQAPLFLPDDGPNRAVARPPSHSVNARPLNGAFVRSAPITVPIARVHSAVPTHADEDFAFQPKDAIIYEPGTYDIILVIDGREVKNKRDEDTLRKELSDKGITIEVKALNLGDMLWIARSRSPTLRGEDQECVLDYVVERKRLDDLCISIRDGRYEEQKFRLNNSCLRNVYYIVEQWNIGGYLGNPDSGNTTAQAVATARSQTQVTDGFFVKDTHKLSETIEYLRLLTEVIIETHQNVPIHVLPSRYISRSSYKNFQTHLRRQHPSTSFHTTYEAFQELNTKAANRTLQETFARMLLCVKQMSSERVSASLNHWRTPRELHEWLKARRIEAEAQESQEAELAALGPPPKTKGKKKQVRGVDLIFADTVEGEGRAKIGDQMSRDLYKIFG